MYIQTTAVALACGFAAICLPVNSLRVSNHSLAVREKWTYKVRRATRCRRTPNADVRVVERDPETMYQDGFSKVACVKDYMYYHGDAHGDNRHDYKIGQSVGFSILKYEDTVAKEDRKAMSPTVCFDFCRNVPGASFFGILNGRDCYCTPYFEMMAGDSSECDATCDGDQSLTCGGKTKSDIFEMHLCADAEANFMNTRDRLFEECRDDEIWRHTEEMCTRVDRESNKGIQDITGGEVTSIRQDLMKELNSMHTICQHWIDLEQKLLGFAEGSMPEDFKSPAGMKQAEEETAKMENLIDSWLVMKKSLREETAVYGMLAKAAVESEGMSPEIMTAAKEFIPAMYFANKSYVDDPSSCHGDLAGPPVFDITPSLCAYACSKELKCKAFMSLEGESSACLMYSGLDELSYYPKCNSGAGDGNGGAGAGVITKTWNLMCRVRFAAYEGTNLNPDASGKRKMALKKLTKICS